MKNKRLFNALDGACIEYTVMHTSRGVPYAGFFWSTDNDTGTDISALIEENVLRLTAHQINMPAVPKTVLIRANALPLGAVYISPDRGVVELSIGLFVGDCYFGTEQLLILLNYLDSSRRFLESSNHILTKPQLKKTENLKGKDIAKVLAQYGHQSKNIEGGVEVDIKLTEEQVCRINIIEDENGWITALAHYVPSHNIINDYDDMLLFQRLQNWATSGRFKLNNNELFVEVCTPLLGCSRDKLITWTTSQSVILLQTAAQHYEFRN